ncbi:hypothetical protein H6G64_35330 [Calothrix sp. FACHB-156]|nr:hypothetical protein [Calothrix sp. FACHB-156]
MTNAQGYKVADSIAVDDEGYCKAVLNVVEYDSFTDDETGEIKDQILFIWDTTTRKGKETKIRFWTPMTINPTAKKVKGKTTYNALTQLLLIHQIITVEDLKKLAADENYLDQMEIDLDSLIGQNHKFKLNYNDRGLGKPDISTLKVMKELKLGKAAADDLAE